MDLIAAKADVGGCGDVVFVNTTFPPAFSHLAARLRRIIFVGQTRLGCGLDFERMGLRPMGRGDTIITNDMGGVQPMAVAGEKLLESSTAFVGPRCPLNATSQHHIRRPCAAWLRPRFRVHGHATSEPRQSDRQKCHWGRSAEGSQKPGSEKIDVGDQTGMVDLVVLQAKVGCRGPRTLAVIKSFRLPGCHFAPCLRRVILIRQSPPNMTPKFRQGAPL